MDKELDKLYNESAYWLKDVEFRQKELEAYDRLLQNRIRDAEDAAARFELEQMQNNLQFYREEVLSQIQKQLSEHKDRIERLMKNYGKISVFQESYHFHYTLKKELESFDHSFHFIKSMLYKHF